MPAFRKMHINWRLKSLMFQAFDRLPLGKWAYYQVQKHVTGTVPRRLVPTAETASCFIDHAASLASRWNGTLSGRLLFEFGAGWDLYGNVVLWCYGVDHQVVYDLTRHAKPAEINVIIRHLAADPPPGAVRTPGEAIVLGPGWSEDLRRRYGIHYTAPADAGQTPFPDSHFDAVLTTSVLEHLPPAAMDRILAETSRILRPDGVMLHAIDYSDHYAHSDPSIGRYNFLRFSQAMWRLHSPALHFQNRWRHGDYERAFAKHGLRPLSVRRFVPPEAAAEIAGVPLHGSFRVCPMDDLHATFGYFELAKAVAELPRPLAA